MIRLQLITLLKFGNLYFKVKNKRKKNDISNSMYK